MVESRGLQYDRRWVLVDENNLFIHQRTYHQMALLQPHLEDDFLKVSHKNDPSKSIVIPYTPESAVREPVTVWKDTCPAVEVSKKVSDWFTEILGVACRLMLMPNDSVRPTHPDFSVHEDDKVSFADGFPIHIISEASVEALNAKIVEGEITAGRFRPNILLSGGHPHIEDELGVFVINGVKFYGVKPCGRCIMTTVNPNTAVAGKEPLKTLATYRRKDKAILFGQNTIPEMTGIIKVGDEVLIKEKLKPIAF